MAVKFVTIAATATGTDAASHGPATSAGKDGGVGRQLCGYNSSIPDLPAQWPVLKRGGRCWGAVLAHYP
jgi:hypothetical protein